MQTANLYFCIQCYSFCSVLFERWHVFSRVIGFFDGQQGTKQNMLDYRKFSQNLWNFTRLLEFLQYLNEFKWLNTTSALYIFMRPLLTFDQFGTPLIFQSWLECSAKGPFLTWKMNLMQPKNMKSLAKLSAISGLGKDLGCRRGWSASNNYKLKFNCFLKAALTN